MAKISHVIFDMDGLLLDTETLYTQGNQMVLDRYGKEFCWEIKAKQMGRKKEEAVRVLLDYYELDVTVEAYGIQVDEVHRRIMPTAQLLPGAERLVRHLNSHNIPIAVATGSFKEFYEIKVQNHSDVFQLFHHVLCGDDPELQRGKPAPDCFHICASRFTPPPAHMEEVLVFEDAPNGVEAALAANCKVVMVPDPRVEKHVRDKATLSFNSLEEFQPEMLGLPPYVLELD